MRRDTVLSILQGAVEAASPVMIHFGFDPENIIVISGPKEPIVSVELYPPDGFVRDELILATTKSNMQFFIDPHDVKLIQVADINDSRFEKKPAPPTGMYN